jgi:hypothetical protein
MKYYRIPVIIDWNRVCSLGRPGVAEIRGALLVMTGLKPTDSQLRKIFRVRSLPSKKALVNQFLIVWWGDKEEKGVHVPTYDHTVKGKSYVRIAEETMNHLLYEDLTRWDLLTALFLLQEYGDLTYTAAESRIKTYSKEDLYRIGPPGVHQWRNLSASLDRCCNLPYADRKGLIKGWTSDRGTVRITYHRGIKSEK